MTAHTTHIKTCQNCGASVPCDGHCYACLSCSYVQPVEDVPDHGPDCDCEPCQMERAADTAREMR
jgi:hypothetical protein